MEPGRSDCHPSEDWPPEYEDSDASAFRSAALDADAAGVEGDVRRCDGETGMEEPFSCMAGPGWPTCSDGASDTSSALSPAFESAESNRSSAEKLSPWSADAPGAPSGRPSVGMDGTGEHSVA